MLRWRQLLLATLSVVFASGRAVGQQQVQVEAFPGTEMRLESASAGLLVPLATNRNDDGHAKTASQATTRILQDEDFITRRKNRWKSLYDVGCKETLVKAVQQRGGGPRAIGGVKGSLWAGEVCVTAQGTWKFYDSETDRLDQLRQHKSISAADLQRLDGEMAQWKQKERELNALMVRLVGHTADHAVCYEHHPSDDPICAPSSDALEAETALLQKFEKWTVADAPGNASPPGLGCASYTSIVALISPCTVAPGQQVIVTMRRPKIVPGSVSFLTGVNNGIAVGGVVQVSGAPGNYAFTVPLFLCASGSNSVFAVRLKDAGGTNQGEIGRLTIDCRTQKPAGSSGGTGSRQ